MDSAEIRKRFLDFFEERGHTVVPSASLIAKDPTLLLVNAGMVPFKPFFLGEQTPPYKRATSVQKCVRTIDIEEVGRTTRHASFFQMAGNFSFGDYFKEGAIKFGWELLTNSPTDGGYGFDAERLWVTIFESDEESNAIWRDVIGVPSERIQRRGMADNFWSMGVPGPCGPCSEIYLDRGDSYGSPGGPIVDEERYLEVWNLVFMQYERGAGQGKSDFPILGDLPAQNIDTGMGLERMAAILQGVDNIYEIDTTKMILDKAARLSGVTYGADNTSDVWLRVVADHSRTAAFLIGDGVTPSNEGRGYVLRRMLRRVVRNMRLLGATGGSVGELVDSAIEAMAPQYPELRQEKPRILNVAQAEEDSFLNTLRSGTVLFEEAVARTRAAGSKTLPGKQAFVLHDTYGFPLDLTLEMATEQGLSVDESEFRALMSEQRSRAQADAKARKLGLADPKAYQEMSGRLGPSKFVGHDELAAQSKVAGLLVGGESKMTAKEHDEVEIVLAQTPFYAESGGQLADTGLIELSNGAVAEVYDVQAPVPGLIVHRARVVSGEIEVGDEVLARVEVERRKQISQAHTATHLIHKAFREALGETAHQAGSENAPGRLRFDFPSPKGVGRGLLSEIEAVVNEKLDLDLPVATRNMALTDAKAMGAMALFGEKYGDVVRVVSIGDWSHELCGGTHVSKASEIGVVSLISEQSIGAGVRRVEALVGNRAFRQYAQDRLLVEELTQILGKPAPEIAAQVKSLVDKARAAEKHLAKAKTLELSKKAAQIATAAKTVGPVSVVVFEEADIDLNFLREMVTAIRGASSTEKPLLVVGASGLEQQTQTVIALNKGAINEGLSSIEVINELSAKFGGKGGGKAEMAQGTIAQNVNQAQLSKVVTDWLESSILRK